MQERLEEERPFQQLLRQKGWQHAEPKIESEDEKEQMVHRQVTPTKPKPQPDGHARQKIAAVPSYDELLGGGGGGKTDNDDSSSDDEVYLINSAHKKEVSGII